MYPNDVVCLRRGVFEGRKTPQPEVLETPEDPRNSDEAPKAPWCFLQAHIFEESLRQAALPATGNEKTIYTIRCEASTAEGTTGAFVRGKKCASLDTFEATNARRMSGSGQAKREFHVLHDERGTVELVLCVLAKAREVLPNRVVYHMPDLLLWKHLYYRFQLF